MKNELIEDLEAEGYLVSGEPSLEEVKIMHSFVINDLKSDNYESIMNTYIVGWCD